MGRCWPWACSHPVTLQVTLNMTTRGHLPNNTTILCVRLCVCVRTCSRVTWSISSEVLINHAWGWHLQQCIVITVPNKPAYENIPVFNWPVNYSVGLTAQRMDRVLLLYKIHFIYILTSIWCSKTSHFVVWLTIPSLFTSRLFSTFSQATSMLMPTSWSRYHHFNRLILKNVSIATQFTVIQ